jgi:hypothetical protein
MLGTGSSDVLTIAGTNVGIGTSTPGVALDVTGNINAQALAVSGGVAIGGAVAVAAPLTASAITAVGAMTVGTNLWVSGSIGAGGSKSGYVVDRFLSRAKKPLARGDVVVLHTHPSTIFYGLDDRIPLIEVTLATKASDTRVCGIVDEPSLPEGQTPGLNRKSIGTAHVGHMVTLGAYAYCKVNADIAPIVAGDLLTTSSTPGHAQKIDTETGAVAGSVIGKALASLKEGKGTIPVLISHQ